MDLYETNNCGVREFDGVQGGSPLEIIKYISDPDNNTGDSDFAFVIFTDNDESTSGRNLETFIRKNKLGCVVKTRAAVNPNSGNKITVWVWEVNKNLKKFA